MLEERTKEIVKDACKSTLWMRIYRDRHNNSADENKMLHAQLSSERKKLARIAEKNRRKMLKNKYKRETFSDKWYMRPLTNYEKARFKKYPGFNKIIGSVP